MAKLRVFGCGGAGVNLTSRYVGREVEPGVAEVLPAYVDTSASNLRGRKADQCDTYLVEGLDGSGKIRAENHKEISRTVKQALVEIPPSEDFNIVIFSGSGGSGSVIGPLIVRELNQRGLPVVSVVVGSDESVIAAENTLKTIKTLDAISRSTEVPVVMSYHHNRPELKRSDIDRTVANTIACLGVLASGQNDALDRLDLIHWLNYTKTNGGQPQLSTLSIVSNAEAFSKIKAPFSVASLYDDPDHDRIQTNADYACDGFADMSSLTDMTEIHFAIGTSDLAVQVDTIKSTVNKMLENRQARVERASIIDKGDTATEDDLIL